MAPALHMGLVAGVQVAEIKDKVHYHYNDNEDSTAFLSLLRTCAKHKDLHRGTKAHEDILTNGLLPTCMDALVTMYAKCGALHKAQELVDKHEITDPISWNALIAGYAREGRGQEALDCFERMQLEGILPNAVTYACILKACASLKAVGKGEQIHDEIARQGLLGHDVVLGTALVDMYARSGALEKARRVLEELHCRDVVAWNALISGYAQHGQGKEALSCYERLQHEGFSPTIVTFVCILKVCGTLRAREKGVKIHDEVASQGLLQDNPILGTALVDMYVKCGAMEKAHRVLEELPSREVSSWNALITGYTDRNQAEQALRCFRLIQLEGLSPTRVTFLGTLRACGSIGEVDRGEEIHRMIISDGFLVGTDVMLGTALVDMYAKCGALAKALRVFEELPARNVISWNALISGYMQHGHNEQALYCFEQMRYEGHIPTAVTFLCILKTCGSIGALDKGEEVHNEIVEQGLLKNDILLGTALVDMYVKCDAPAKARLVLEELPARDVVSWSALIAGYAKQGEGEQALHCFEEMQLEGFSPDVVTFICILKACGTIGAAEKGKEIHDEIARQGLLEVQIVLGNALVDMYARCGSLTTAQTLLEELPSRDTVSWNALMGGYAHQGNGGEVASCFEKMRQESLPPDSATFSSVLNACNHLGQAADGPMLFGKMSTLGGVQPDTNHYTCLVDLFARAGQLEEAMGVIQEMSIMPSSGHHPIWSALLSACQKLGDVNVGRWAFEQAGRVQKFDLGAHVLMANIYAAAGLQEDTKEMEAREMDKFGQDWWTNADVYFH